jgi:hypothetical protein
MSFGRNPYVPKAQAAEQKAEAAPDEAARVRALRDAAHQWDRAAEREKPGKQRTEYESNAERTRAAADGEGAGDGDAAPETEPATPVAPKLMN